MYLCLLPRLLITDSVVWYDMNSVGLIKQVLLQLYMVAVVGIVSISYIGVARHFLMLVVETNGVGVS